MRKPIEIPIKVVEVVTDKIPDAKKSPYRVYGELYAILAESTDPVAKCLRLRDILMISTEGITLIIDEIHEEGEKIVFKARVTDHFINLEPVLKALESVVIFGSTFSHHDESEIY